MNVIYDIDKTKSLINRIRGYMRTRGVYIGITDNPEQRAEAHDSNYNALSWYQKSRTPKPHTMVVLRKSTSRTVIRNLERELIANIGVSNLENERGGGGNIGTGPTFYLYVRLSG